MVIRIISVLEFRTSDCKSKISDVEQLNGKLNKNKRGEVSKSPTLHLEQYKLSKIPKIYGL